MARHAILIRAHLMAGVIALAGCATITVKTPDVQERAVSDDMARYKRALDINPQNAHAWYLKGRSSLVSGQTRDARHAFEEALLIQPDFSEARIGLAVANMDAGRWFSAIKGFEEHLRRNPESVAGWEGLAAAHLGNEDLPGAQNAAAKAIELDPKSRQGHRILGEVHYVRGDYAEALASWQQALEDGSLASELEPIVKDLRQYTHKYESR